MKFYRYTVLSFKLRSIAKTHKQTSSVNNGRLSIAKIQLRDFYSSCLTQKDHKSQALAIVLQTSGNINLITAN